MRSWRRISVGGLGFDPLTEAEVVTYVRGRLGRGIGGWVVTPNVDILRQLADDPGLRADMGTADLVVADGTPLVWASRLARTPLPGRVAGSDLVWSLSGALARDGRSVYLLGGEPASEGVDDGSTRAAAVLASTYPGLRIAGHASPAYGFDADDGELAEVCAEVIESKPDLVYVGLGFPRQERLIARLRGDLPGAWFLGCGAALRFVAGDQRRAARWMQRAGLEWLHRLVQEPGRLGRRYLRDDAPYALRLLGTAGRARFARRRSR